MAERINTEWMWATEDGGVNGLKLDAEGRALEWFDEVGCACGDASHVQTFDHYHAFGPALSDVPDDVIGELTRALSHFKSRG